MLLSGDSAIYFSSLMLGLTFIDFLRFVMQAGLAFAAASALWGAYYSWNNRDKVAAMLFKPLLAGTVVFFIGFAVFAIFYPDHVFAHEGISLTPDEIEVQGGMSLIFPVIILLLLTVPLGALAVNEKRRTVAYYLLVLLILMSAIAFQIFDGFMGDRQTFFSLHTIHSVFTLGTVLVIDYLYVMSTVNKELKLDIYPHFDRMSSVIWLGLGLDFISVYPILGEAFVATPKFYFAQTLIAVIIINGALLSGKISAVLKNSIKDGVVRPLPKKWLKVMSVSGAVSIVSWLTITFIDFFPDLSLSYLVLIALYLLAIIVAFISEKAILKLAAKRA